MAKDIGRLHMFGIGAEASPGTLSTIDAWIPLQEGNLKVIAENIKDDSGIGLIDEVSDVHIVKKMSEISLKGVARSKSLPWLLFGTLGTAGAPTLVETGVYTHAMSRLNSNSHPTFTVIHDNATAEEQVLYAMMESLKLAFEVGSQAKFDAIMKGKSPTTSTGTTPAYTAGDEPFLVSNMAVKFATNVAGLGAAPVVPVQMANVEILKNLTQIFSTSTAVGTEVLDFASQHNQNFNVAGDIEIVFNDETYKTLFTGGTKQAMSITITGKTLIGATKYNQLTFTFPAVVLEDWDRKISNNEIITQTFGFTATYDVTNTATVTCVVQNSISAQYE